MNKAITAPHPPKPGAVRAFWRWLTRGGEPRSAQPASPADLKLARTTFRDCLAGTGGEASARARVATLASLYRSVNDEGRDQLLGLLVEEFGPDELAVNSARQIRKKALRPIVLVRNALAVRMMALATR